MSLLEEVDNLSKPETPIAVTAEAPAEKGLRGIQEVAEYLQVTHRTLRFYEDKGLIEPTRVGSTRVYSRKDVARMQLILRGKRLGFSIREIKEFLDLYDADPQHIEQNRLLRKKVRERLKLLAAQQAALEQTMVELKQIEREVVEQIAAQK
jgi:DNA-binding transcriptional MerR regulator